LIFPFDQGFLGLPLGGILYAFGPHGLHRQTHIYAGLGLLVNILRSIPFIILMIAIIPFTRFIVGTSIGTSAAIVPLSLAAIPFFARIVEAALSAVQPGLREMGIAIGGNQWQILRRILLAVALPSIIRGFTLMLITLVGYSAMAGAVGGGGLGDVAITYGYQRFNTSIMLATVIILVVLVQIIQFFGERVAKQTDKQQKGY